METLKDNNLYLRILKFWEKNQKWFAYPELQQELQLEDWEDDIIKVYLYNAVLNNRERNEGLHETMFIKININSQRWVKWTSPVIIIDPSETEKINESLANNHFIIKYDAYFNYVDYLELKKAIENSNEANTHAKWAKNLALWAIWIAIITWLFQISEDSLLLEFLCNLF